MEKQGVVEALKALLEKRAQELRAGIATTLEARNSDTKSSAGDKHEVGRAMVQQELDQLEAQLGKAQAMLQELARVPLVRTEDTAGIGSLVTTAAGLFLIAVAFGAIEVDGVRYFALSAGSPMGQALLGKRAGDVALVNGKAVPVLAIA